MPKQNIDDACSCSHFHDIYIEHTVRTRFRVAPKTVTSEGPLSRKWKTVLCSRVELGPEGIYVPYNLDVYPHWSAPREKRKSISDQVLKQTSNHVRSNSPLLWMMTWWLWILAMRTGNILRYSSNNFPGTILWTNYCQQVTTKAAEILQSIEDSLRLTLRPSTTSPSHFPVS